MSAPAHRIAAPRAPQQPADERARLIRLVHVGRRELKLAEGEYRTILQAQGGADSSASMSVVELKRVVDYMKRQGFKVASKPKPGGQLVVAQKASRVGVTYASQVASALAGGLRNDDRLKASSAVVLASDPESRKARAMWLTLHAIGQVRDPSEAALLAYAKRQTKVERLEWVADMVPVLEPLKAWLLRSLPDKVKPYLREASRSWAPHMADAWHENWDQAVRQLRLAFEKGNVQLVDEWVGLWQLIVSQQISKKRG